MDNFGRIINELITIKDKFEIETKIKVNSRGLEIIIPKAIFTVLESKEDKDQEKVKQDVDNVMDEVVNILGAILMENEDGYIEKMVKNGHLFDEQKEKFNLVRDLMINDKLVKNFKFQSSCTNLIFGSLESEILYKEISKEYLVRYAQIRLIFENNEDSDNMETMVFEANEDSLTDLIDRLTEVRDSLIEKVTLDGFKLS